MTNETGTVEVRDPSASSVALLLFGLLVGLLLLPALLGCRPSAAEAAPALTLDDPIVRLQGTGLWVVGTWRLGPDDGLGPIDSIVTTAGLNTGSGGGRHGLPPTAVRDSFAMPKPAAGATTSGFFCAQTKRRSLLSTSACKPWSYTTPDQAPPPPVLDTPRVLGLRLWPDPGKVLAGAPRQFCAFGILSDSTVVRDSKPAGHPGIRYCDSVGQALYGARYASASSREAP